MEKMTQAEKKMLRELQAKEKRVQRAEADFYKEADLRKEELIERWEIKDMMKEAAEIVKTDPDTLFRWITSDSQISFFRKKHLSNQTQEIKDVFENDNRSV